MLLNDFEPLPGAHCESSMLRNMLHHDGISLSESMVFGLGEGIDFQRHLSPPAPPMLTGRIGAGDIARNACTALGVELIERQLEDAGQAQAEALRLLEAGRVVGVTVDIFHLDYFASRVHFSAHCIALYGFTDDLVHVVDTEQQGGPQRLPATSLRKARASNEGFMPSPNRQFHLEPNSSCRVGDLEALIVSRSWPAMRSAARRILGDRGPNLGLAGLRRAGSEFPALIGGLEDPTTAIQNMGRFWRFAGTGDNNFRRLWTSFLREVAERSRHRRLLAVVQEFEAVSRQWSELIDLLIDFSGAGDHDSVARAAGARLGQIADAEAQAFTRLGCVADAEVAA